MKTAVNIIPIAGLTAALATGDATRTVKRAATCTFTSVAQVSASKTACSSIVLDGIAVPAGETLDLTGLNDGTTVTFQGTTTFGYKQWTGPLVSFSGNDLTVTGASGHLINGNGAAWWDGKGSNGGTIKPTMWYAHNVQKSTFSNLHIENTPVQCFSIDGSENVNFLDITIDDSAGDANNLGHNTDGFDIGSSSGIYISGAIVKNQDDCLAVNSGSDITFTGGTCSGGHGLSIGSVGGRDDNTVSNVNITSSSVSNSANGVRVKTVSGATGAVSNVRYESITLSGITEYGVVIEQDYENGDPTGKPTNGVKITDLILDGVKGTVTSGATDVYILCGSGSCSDWTWDGVSVTGGKKSSACENVPSGASC